MAYNIGQGTWTIVSALASTTQVVSCDTDGSGRYQCIGHTSVTSNGGVWVSYDYGSNWTRKLALGSVRGTAYSRNGQYLLVSGTSGTQQIWLSSDYGSNFSRLTTPSIAAVNCTACSSNGQYMSFVDQSGFGYVFTSSNYGSNWTTRLNDTARFWTGCSISDDGQWQAACHNGGLIYVSSDYGATYTTRNVTDQYWYVAMSGSGQYMLAIAFTGNYYVSSNYGSNWTTFSGYGGPIFRDCWVSQSGQLMLVAARGPRIAKASSNYGVTWVDTTSPSAAWNAISASDNGQYILAGNDSLTNATYLSISPQLIFPPDAPTNVQVSGTNLVWTAPSQTVDLYKIFSFSN